MKSIRLFLRDRIGWNRIGIAIGVTITAVAAFVLYDLLQDIRPREVYAALRRTDTSNIVIAALFVAAGYITLTFYDYFALRTIGRPDVPYRIAALAGFTSYSIGHNVGASLFSGGTVRYRVYSTASGLSAIEVAKICFIAGLTFWLGNIAVLGLGMWIDPEAASAVDRLPPYVNRLLGMTAVAVLVCYVIWVSIAPRHFGEGVFEVRLPSGNLTLLQIAIGIVDLMCCAAAMYVLMPDRPDIDFISLAVIFIAATLLGFASHTPGGIGVFDAAMLLALRQFNKEELLGALLLFRLLYYITPFALSLAVIGFRELVLDIKPLIAPEGEARQRAKPAERRSRNGVRRRPRRRSPSTAL